MEAAKQARTATELSKAFQVHPVQISQWKKHLLDNIETLFRDGRRREREEGQARQAELLRADRPAQHGAILKQKRESVRGAQAGVSGPVAPEAWRSGPGGGEVGEPEDGMEVKPLKTYAA